MGIVDIIFLGHMGKGNLAAAIIGNAFVNVIWFFIEGYLTAQDTLAANAFGMKDYKAVRYWSYISMATTGALCVFATLVSLFAEPIIGTGLLIHYHMATKAAVHVYLLMPGIWCLAAFRVIQKYLQAQNIMTPSIVSSLIGNAVNILGE